MPQSSVFYLKICNIELDRDYHHQQISWINSRLKQKKNNFVDRYTLFRIHGNILSLIVAT